METDWIVGNRLNLLSQVESWTDPAGQAIEPLVDGESTYIIFDQPGIYRGSRDGRSLEVAVNIDPSESEVQVADLDLLERLGVQFTPDIAPSGNSHHARQLQAIELEAEQGWWRWLLGAVVSAITLESIISIWRGLRNVDTRLENELRSILLRYRLTSVAWWLAMIWMGASLLLILAGSSLAPIASPRTWTRWLLAFSMLAIAAAWLASRLRYRSIHWIAGRIEHRFPELRQRLWTAMGIDTTQPVGFLPQTVLNETISHAGQHDWRQVLPGDFGSLFSWLTQSAALCLFVWSCAAMVA